MGSFVIVLYTVIAVAVACAAVLLWRHLRRASGKTGRRWVDRNGADRRQRKVPVPVDRRRDLRRKDDQAKEFMRELEP